MSLTEIEVTGTLHADGTLVLDEKPNVPPGRVTVVVRAAPQAVPPPEESWWAFMQRARRQLEAAGGRFLSEEEVTAWVEELRADDDRLEQVYRDIEEGRRRE